MITIHGRKTSSNVQAVMWLIAELGLDYDRLDIGGHFGGNDTAQFLAMNPMGQVPVLQEADLTLCESQAIIRYLAQKPEAASLWPDTPAKRAVIDQWMEWAKQAFYPVITYKVFWQLIRVSAAERNFDLIAEGEAELQKLMKIADAQIAKNGWLAGSEFSVADISFGTHLYRYFTADFKRGDFPALAAYYDRLCMRQTYQAHVMISYESLRAKGA